MITSLKNPKVKLVRALQASRRARRQERLYVLEGQRLLDEVVRQAGQPLLVLHTDHLSERGRGLINNLARLGAAVDIVSEEVMQACSATEHNQGLLAVLPMPQPPSSAPLTFALICDRIADPGNLGTIVRTADAVGVDAVFLAPGTVDVYNPKVVRGAAGAHLRLPLVHADWSAIREQVAGCAVWLAEARAGLQYTAVDWSVPVALIVGSETRGISQAARELARGSVHIPMPGGAESLNVAVAAGALLLEIVRQRRSVPGQIPATSGGAASAERNVQARGTRAEKTAT